MVVSSILPTGGYKNFFCYNIASLAACNSVGKALDSWRSALCQRFWVFQGAWGLTGEKKQPKKNSAFLLRWISNQIRSKIKKCKQGVWKDLLSVNLVGFYSKRERCQSSTECVSVSYFISKGKFKGDAAFDSWARWWQRWPPPLGGYAWEHPAPMVQQHFRVLLSETALTLSPVRVFSTQVVPHSPFSWRTCAFSTEIFFRSGGPTEQKAQMD